MQKTKLSVCMIVKNEEQFIADCLKSVQPVADQIVVVDTGSTDQTVEIARSFGAEVHNFKWCDDFAAARNASIKYAKGDWIFWLDADERLEADSLKPLKQLLKPEKRPVAYLITIKNLLADGKTFKLSTGHRLFTNHKKLYFEGRVHEQIVYSLARNGGEERPSNIRLLHLGYGLGAEVQARKDQRNRELLLKMVEEQPNNAYAHYTLGQNYGLAGNHQKALKHYLIALEKQKFQKSLARQLLNNISEAYLKLGNFTEAKRFAEQSLKMSNQQIGAYYLQYKIAQAQDQISEAVQWLQRLREKNLAVSKGRLQIENDILLSDNDILSSMAELFLKLNELSKAESCLTEIIGHSDATNDLIKKMANLLIRYQAYELCLKLLQEHMNTTDVEILDLIGVVQIKQQNFIGAIQTYTQILQQQPNNFEVIKRLAGLFFKIGEKEKGESLLKILNDLNQFNQVSMQ